MTKGKDGYLVIEDDERTLLLSFCERVKKGPVANADLLERSEWWIDVFRDGVRDTRVVLGPSAAKALLEYLRDAPGGWPYLEYMTAEVCNEPTGPGR